MTPVEQMIYAVTWANRYREETQPDRIPHECFVGEDHEDRWEQYEVNGAATAAEAAAYAVPRFRELGPRLREGFGESEVLALYRETKT